ncbi:Nucleolar protein 13 [Cryptotrichosporon argae]
MSDDAPKLRKSGRTPEQQAARDARKAAKLAAAAAVTVHAESPVSASAAESHTPASGKGRRRRDADAAGEGGGEGDGDADELEIDVDAPAPLSKAEARAAKKRAKKGLPEIDIKAAPKARARADDLRDFEDGAKARARAGRKEADGSADEGEDGGETSAASRRKAKKEKAGEAKDKEKKGQYSIWVGNIAFKTTPEGLQEFLERGVVELGGTAGSVTRVNLPKTKGKGSFSANKGFAYVDFVSEEMQALGVQLSERHLDGRRLLIKKGNDHAPTPNARTPKLVQTNAGSAGILTAQKHGESSTLFIGNLPFDATEDELRALVEGNATAVAVGTAAGADGERDVKADVDVADKEVANGADQTATAAAAAAKLGESSRSGVKSGLVKTRVAQFEDTQRCKGFAFWDFVSPAHAKSALLNRKNHYLRGHKLVVQFASAEAASRAGRKRGADGDRQRPPRGERPEHGGGSGGGGERRERPAKRFRPDAPPHAQARDDGDDAGEADAERHVHVRKQTDRDLVSVVLGGNGGGAGEGGAAPERKAWAERAGGGDRADKRGKKWESTGRPRPGAALAMAKREKVGIVESSGSKIVFD